MSIRIHFAIPFDRTATITCPTREQELSASKRSELDIPRPVPYRLLFPVRRAESSESLGAVAVNSTSPFGAGWSRSAQSCKAVRCSCRDILSPLVARTFAWPDSPARKAKCDIAAAGPGKCRTSTFRFRGEEKCNRRLFSLSGNNARRLGGDARFPASRRCGQETPKSGESPPSWPTRIRGRRSSNSRIACR